MYSELFVSYIFLSRFLGITHLVTFMPKKLNSQLSVDILNG